MTETNTHDVAALVVGALAVLTPIGILLVIALLGGGVPHGAEIALYAIPVVLLVATHAAFARLGQR